MLEPCSILCKFCFEYKFYARGEILHGRLGEIYFLCVPKFGFVFEWDVQQRPRDSLQTSDWVVPVLFLLSLMLRSDLELAQCQLSKTYVNGHTQRIARVGNSFCDLLIVSWLENTRNNLSEKKSSSFHWPLACSSSVCYSPSKFT